MTLAAAVLSGAAILLAAWSYLFYPALLRRLARAAISPAGPAPSPVPAPSVEVFVSAADEEAVIGDRVRDLLAQEVPGDYRIAVGCDGCRDATADRAREAAGGDRRVRVVEFPHRRGKAAVLNDLLAASDARVAVFTDANTRFDPGAVQKLAAALSAEGVGAACGRLVLEAEGGERTPETAFWERESALKEAEGRLGVCLGANGAIYAAVKPPRLPAGEILDDFWIPARIAASGADVVFVQDAVAREPAPSDVRRELGRRFRIGLGAGQLLRRNRWLWRPGRPHLFLVFFSRKFARWTAPVLALAAAFVSLASPSLRSAGIGVLAAAALFLLLAPAGPPRQGLAGRLYYFAVINLALSAGVVAGLAGHAVPAWKGSPR